MSYEFIKVEKKDHITIITINRPEVMNALHPPACKEMDDAFNDFDDDPDAATEEMLEKIQMLWYEEVSD